MVFLAFCSDFIREHPSLADCTPFVMNGVIILCLLFILSSRTHSTHISPLRRAHHAFDVVFVHYSSCTLLKLTISVRWRTVYMEVKLWALSPVWNILLIVERPSRFNIAFPCLQISVPLRRTNSLPFMVVQCGNLIAGISFKRSSTWHKEESLWRGFSKTCRALSIGGSRYRQL